jgi:hypothetical protein
VGPKKFYNIINISNKGDEEECEEGKKKCCEGSYFAFAFGEHDINMWG